MNRIETIATINSQLATLADEHILTVAGIIQSLHQSEPPLRRLSERELDLIEQSKADFREGRTHSLSEARAAVDAGLALRRKQRAGA